VGDVGHCYEEYYCQSGTAGETWKVQSAPLQCSFASEPSIGAAGATGMTGASGTAGTTGGVACQWTGFVADNAAQTCQPSPTVTCLGSDCLCFEPDGGFLSAFADAVPGACESNLARCTADGAGPPDSGS
jgi:hypothetical protein